MQLLLRVLMMAIFVFPAFSQGEARSKIGETPEQNEVELPAFSEPSSKIYLENAIVDTLYIVGPGDVLAIKISGPISKGFTLKIGPTGSLMIPEIGQVDLLGHTLSEAIIAIKQRIELVVNGAIGEVSLYEIRQFRVWVYGAVQAPGYYVVNPTTRVYEAAQMAGLDNSADYSKIIVTHGNHSSSELNWFSLLSKGDFSQNPKTIEGDKIFIPFMGFENQMVSVRGAVETPGYYAIEAQESVSSFLNRTIEISIRADVSSIYIMRSGLGDNNQTSISPQSFNTFILQAGDVIEILSEQEIKVSGYVTLPGKFDYVPGQTVLDYIAQAGGALPNGNIKKLEIIRDNKYIDASSSSIIIPGDIIIINRRISDIVFGEISILQLFTSTATIILSYLAITK